MTKNGAKLEDLLPSTPQATINGKLYQFRAPNLADDKWISENIGDHGALKEMVNKLDWDRIAKLAYHLIDDDGRMEFRARKVTIVSETTGDQVERMHTGPEELLRRLDSVPAGVQVMGAIVRAMANSNPMIGDLVKKSLMEAKVFLLNQEKRIGAKSMTRLRVNTNGRKKKSRG